MSGQQANKLRKAEYNGRAELGNHLIKLIQFGIRITAVWIFSGSADFICKTGILMSTSL